MESFEQTAQGRLLTLAVTLPLAVGACVPMRGDAFDTLAITGGVFGGIVLATFAVFASVDERPKYAIASILALPPAFVFYFPLLAVAGQVPAVRVLMALVAGALLGVLAKGALLGERDRYPLPARRIAYSRSMR
jgi:hypothetical protein